MCKSKCVISPYCTLIIYTYTCALLYIDRAALTAEIYRLKSHSDGGLGLSSVEAGALGSSFIIGFIVFCPFFAYFSQKMHPEYLICIGLSVWCCAVFLTGISRTYIMLLGARCITGIGDASFLALAPACIMEKAPAQKKSV